MTVELDFHSCSTCVKKTACVKEGNVDSLI